MGLIICLILFASIGGIVLFKIMDILCPIGIVSGVFIGALIWCMSAYCVEQIADVELINSISYKIEEIDRRYWKTTPESDKEIWYIDEGKELQSQIVNKHQIKYSNEITEPILTIKTYRFTGWFIKFWCGDSTDFNTEFSEYEVIMPQFN